MSARPRTSRGARVEGVDLREADMSLSAALRDALTAHHVLFFRGQRLDDAGHRHVAELLGPPMVHPFEAAMG